MMCVPGNQFFDKELLSSPYNYLEIGVFNGDGLSTLATNHKDKIIYGIDPFIEDGCTTNHSMVNENEFMPAQRANTLKNIENLPNIVLFETTSRDFFNSLTEEMIEEMNIGWVLIDGSHHYNDVTIDYNLALKLIGSRTGGLVFDDVNLPGVAQAYEEFLKIYKDIIGEAMYIYETHPGNILAHRVNPQ